EEQPEADTGANETDTGEPGAEEAPVEDDTPAEEEPSVEEKCGYVVTTGAFGVNATDYVQNALYVSNASTTEVIDSDNRNMMMHFDFGADTCENTGTVAVTGFTMWIEDTTGNTLSPEGKTARIAVSGTEMMATAGLETNYWYWDLEAGSDVSPTNNQTLFNFDSSNIPSIIVSSSESASIGIGLDSSQYEPGRSYRVWLSDVSWNDMDTGKSYRMDLHPDSWPMIFIANDLDSNRQFE
ncbi:hypothetical protein JW899_04750, partial [Candidatus Uhrbacteria bacterium]|nr:hypothetical protein [Candidatus Uhrbacteria bacterium]